MKNGNNFKICLFSNKPLIYFSLLVYHHLKHKTHLRNEYSSCFGAIVVVVVVVIYRYSVYFNKYKHLNRRVTRPKLSAKKVLTSQSAAFIYIYKWIWIIIIIKKSKQKEKEKKKKLTETRREARQRRRQENDNKWW